MTPPTSTDIEPPPALSGLIRSADPDHRAARAELAALRGARRAQLQQPPLVDAPVPPVPVVPPTVVEGGSSPEPAEQPDEHPPHEDPAGEPRPRLRRGGWGRPRHRAAVPAGPPVMDPLVGDLHHTVEPEPEPEPVSAPPRSVATAAAAPVKAAPDAAEEEVAPEAAFAEVAAEVGAVDASAAKVAASGTAAIDPRFEARRAEVAREERRRRRIRVLALVGVLAGIGGGFGLTRTPALDVDHIAITGWSHDQRADILAASGVGIGTQLVDIDPEAAANRIEALVPWVGAARVTRNWPGSVLITVVERRPVARVLSDRGTWLVLDGAGHLLEEADTPQPDLITIEGFSPGATPGAVLTAAAARGVGVLAQMSPSLLSRVDALRFVHRNGAQQGAASPFNDMAPGTPGGGISLFDANLPGTSEAFVAAGGPDVELVLTPAGAVAFGPPEQVQMKLLALETVLARVDLTCLEAIDVRVPRRPLVKRSADCEAQLAG